MKSVLQNNLIFIEQYSRTNGYDFNRNAKFTIIKKIEKDINIKSIIKKSK